jgi:hypothetical protein
MLLNKSSSCRVPLLVTSLLLLTQSCRTPLRTENEAAGPSPIEVSLTNMTSVDRNRAELQFTVSGCGTSTASGTKITTANANSTVILFESQSIHAGDVCKIQVLSDNPKSSAENWFDEPGVMYSAPNVKIRHTSGKLTGVAILQQKYAAKTGDLPANQLWKLTATVKSPEPFTGVCTCALTSVPVLANSIAKLEIRDGNTTGSCLFVNLISPLLESTACSKLTVQCAADIYEGQWPAGTTVDGMRPKDWALPELVLTKVNPNDIVDSIIDVSLPGQ